MNCKDGTFFADLKRNGIDGETLYILDRERITSRAVFMILSENDISQMRLPIGQFAVLRHLLTKYKEERPMDKKDRKYLVGDNNCSHGCSDGHDEPRWSEELIEVESFADLNLLGMKHCLKWPGHLPVEFIDSEYRPPERMNIGQWSMANARILEHLIIVHGISKNDVLNYLIYTEKLGLLFSQYRIDCVLRYDHEFRKTRVRKGWAWTHEDANTMAFHLTHRKTDPEKDFVTQKSASNISNSYQKPRHQLNTVLDVCRDFNFRTCRRQRCPKRHVCILDGCQQAHTAIDHRQPESVIRTNFDTQIVKVVHGTEDTLIDI